MGRSGFLCRVVRQECADAPQRSGEKIRVGDKVTINVNPSRRLPNLGYFRTATLPDGTVLKDCGFAAFRESVANGTSSAADGECAMRMH